MAAKQQFGTSSTSQWPAAGGQQVRASKSASEIAVQTEPHDGQLDRMRLITQEQTATSETDEDDDVDDADDADDADDRRRQLQQDDLDNYELGGAAGSDNNNYDNDPGDDDMIEIHFGQLRKLFDLPDLLRRSNSLDNLLQNSFVHQSADGKQFVISRAWPSSSGAKRSRRRRADRAAPSDRLALQRRSVSDMAARSRPRAGLTKLMAGKAPAKASTRISQEEKQQLLLDFLSRNVFEQDASLGGLQQANLRLVEKVPLEFPPELTASADISLGDWRNAMLKPIESTLKVRLPSSKIVRGKLPQPRLLLASGNKHEQDEPTGNGALLGGDAAAADRQQVRARGRRKSIIVHYDLPQALSQTPIALAASSI